MDRGDPLLLWNNQANDRGGSAFFHGPNLAWVALVATPPDGQDIVHAEAPALGVQPIWRLETSGKLFADVGASVLRSDVGPVGEGT